MCVAHGGDGKTLMKNLSIRLKAYKPNGDTLGLLPPAILVFREFPAR